MPYDNAGKHTMLDALGAAVDAVGIHTGDPGTGATNEVSGGGYSRQTPSFAAASGGAMTLSAGLNFTGPASTDALWFTIWASGTRQGKGQITTGDQAFNAAGEFTLTAGTTLDIADS
jgi:hypothetical protein